MPRSPWILSRYWDISLFIASPLLVIATLVPLRLWTGSENLSLWLLAFFTFGHHLPGFLRAYGDRDLFARYRWRFLLAPPLIFSATYLFDSRGLHGLLLLVFTWDIWHVMMQHYGFLRLYDSRMGLGDARTAWLDWAVSLSWYVTFIVASPHYRHDFLYRLFSSGVPVLPEMILDVLTNILWAASLALTMWYILHTVRRPRNWYKLATLACFVFATWFLYVKLNDFVAGFAIWSAFHCLQYFGIVWAWNRKQTNLAAWVKPWFQPRALWILAYVAVILLYGAINYGQSSRLLMCFVITSGTLHYYYDAFMWKIQPQRHEHGWRSPGFAQGAMFAAGLGVLAWIELSNPVSEERMREALARLSPEAAISHLNWAENLRTRGRLEAAAAEFELAFQSDRKLEIARERSGLLYAQAAVESLRAGNRADATRLFARVAATNPSDAGARVNLGNVLMMEGRAEEAEREFRAALTADPHYAMAHGNLGVLLVRSGRRAEAASHLQFALRHGDEAVRRAAQQAMEMR